MLVTNSEACASRLEPSIAGQGRHGGERAATIDTIRAIALFGVIVMNTIAVTMVIANKEVLASATALDMTVGLTDFVLLQGKARACFALLFGMGFGLLLSRAPDSAGAYPAFFARRMLALFGFGVFNQVFLFWGDILAHYALFGALLPFFRRWSNRTLLATGFGLVLLPPAAFALAFVLNGGPLPNLAGHEPSAAFESASALIYRHGSYLDVVVRNMGFQLRAYFYDSFHRAEYDMSLLGLFLIGFVAARVGLPSDITRHRALLWRVVIWCAPLGLLVSLLHLTNLMKLGSEPWLRAAGMVAFFGPTILALAMMAAGALWLDRGGSHLKHWLAPAGRLALTNYLLSGFIASWTTYGFGLGLLSRLNLAGLTLLGCAIYVVLVLFSSAWLQRFRVGPAEWLLRSATYAELQSLRRPQSLRA